MIKACVNVSGSQINSQIYPVNMESKLLTYIIEACACVLKPRQQRGSDQRQWHGGGRRIDEGVVREGRRVHLQKGLHLAAIISQLLQPQFRRDEIRGEGSRRAR